MSIQKLGGWIMLLTVMGSCSFSVSETEYGDFIHENRTKYITELETANYVLKLYTPPTDFVVYQSLKQQNKLDAKLFEEANAEMKNTLVAYLDVFIKKPLLQTNKTDTNLNSRIKEQSQKFKAELSHGLALEIENKIFKPTLFHFEASHGILPYERAIVYFEIPNDLKNSEKQLKIQSNELFQKPLLLAISEPNNSIPILDFTQLISH